MATHDPQDPFAYLKISDQASAVERDRADHLSQEWLTAEQTFNNEKVLHTISIFGSARIPAPEQCHDTDPCVGMTPYYAAARELARLAGDYIQQHQLHHTRLITGGGPGIMEAASRGALEAGHESIGLNIVIPREQRVNPFIAAKHSIEFQYFALRKMHFLKRARALVVFPGGFGTLDELFETLTLIQTGKMPRVPIFLYGRNFWNQLIDLPVLAQNGLIDEADLDLYHVVDSVADTWEQLADIMAGLRT